MATIAEALAVAQQYYQAGHLREAEQIYRQIVRAEPNCGEAWHSLGAVCLAQADICNDRGISFAQREDWTRPSPTSARRCKSIPIIQEHIIISASSWPSAEDWKKR